MTYGELEAGDIVYSSVGAYARIVLRVTHGPTATLRHDQVEATYAELLYGDAPLVHSLVHSPFAHQKELRIGSSDSSRRVLRGSGA